MREKEEKGQAVACLRFFLSSFHENVKRPTNVTRFHIPLDSSRAFLIELKKLRQGNRPVLTN